MINYDLPSVNINLVLILQPIHNNTQRFASIEIGNVGKGLVCSCGLLIGLCSTFGAIADDGTL